jgi:hypothetical protein
MTIKIVRTSVAPSISKKVKSNGHTKAVAPTISLDQPGRLRVAHLMSLLGVSHSTLYEGMKRKRYPEPDGWDGKIPYWNTHTLKHFLQGGD